MPTKIEWTNETWNPVTGCSKASPGCANCYADAMCRRFWKQWGRDQPPDHFSVKLHEDRLLQPFGWRTPKRVFVCSMGDLFHKDVPGWFLTKIFWTMRQASQHTYQVLTKRADLMYEWCRHDLASDNVWLGVSAEDQVRADERISYLLKLKTLVKFVSLEPLLGPIELERGRYFLTNPGPRLSWVIIGCESGPHRRAMEIEWAIDLVRQCRAAGVPVFVKQIEVYGKVSKDPSIWPEELRIREYPRVSCATPVRGVQHL